ncbi:hypothetical protein LguiB_031768 [Lonicera macranthoides]
MHDCRSIERLLDLSNLTKLKKLRLSACEMLHEVKGLTVLESLKILDLSDCKSMEEFPDLSSLKNLVELKIYGLDDLTAIRVLEELKSLEWLDISYWKKLTEMRGIEELKSLKYMEIWGCRNPDLPYLANTRVEFMPSNQTDGKLTGGSAAAWVKGHEMQTGLGDYFMDARTDFTLGIVEKVDWAVKVGKFEITLFSPRTISVERESPVPIRSINGVFEHRKNRCLCRASELNGLTQSPGCKTQNCARKLTGGPAAAWVKGHEMKTWRRLDDYWCYNRILRIRKTTERHCCRVGERPQNVDGKLTGGSAAAWVKGHEMQTDLGDYLTRTTDPEDSEALVHVSSEWGAAQGLGSPSRSFGDNPQDIFPKVTLRIVNEENTSYKPSRHPEKNYTRQYPSRRENKEQEKRELVSPPPPPPPPYSPIVSPRRASSTGVHIAYSIMCACMVMATHAPPMPVYYIIRWYLDHILITSAYHVSYKALHSRVIALHYALMGSYVDSNVDE